MIKINGRNHFNYYIDEKSIIAMTEWEDELGSINLDIYFKNSQIPQYIVCESKEEREKFISEVLKNTEK